MENINELVVSLARARADYDAGVNAVEAIKQQISASALGRELEAAMAALDASKRERDEIESSLRDAVVQYYADTGEKHPHAAATCQVSTSPVYDDGDAIACAKQAMPTLVKTSLDKRGFNKVARTGELPFVTLEETPKAVVSRDLSEWMPVRIPYEWHCVDCEWQSEVTQAVYEVCPKCGGEVLDIPF